MVRIMKNVWRLDTRIPVAVLISCLLQVAGALIWATQLDARVNTLEERTLDGKGLNEKFARLEERLDFMKQDLAGMKQQLDHLTDKLIGQ